MTAHPGRPRQSLSGILLLSLAILLAGCGGSGGSLSATTGTRDDGLTAGTLFGKVTNATTGDGLGGAQMTITRTSGTTAKPAKTSASAQADSTITMSGDGSYEAPQMLAGTYQVKVSMSGYGSYTAEVAVVGGQRIEYNVKMYANGGEVVIPSGSGRLKGVMRDGSGKVVAGAVITLSSGSDAAAKTAGKIFSATTTSSGEYVLDAVPAGVYAVSITHSSFLHQRFSTTITAGQVNQLDLVLQPGNPAARADIFGFVRDNRGRPIVKANVSLDYTILRAKTASANAADPNATVAGVTQTDENGFYAFSNVVPGTYTVKAEHPEYLANAASVTVGAGQSVQQDIILNWKLVFNGKADYFLSVWGTSTSNVFVVGSLGVIKHFDGSEWKYQTSPTGEHLFNVWGTRDGSLVLAIGNGNTLVRSTDGGATWTVSGAGVGASCHAVWGTDDGSEIYLVSITGSVYRSTDRGLTWSVGVYSPTALPAPRSNTDLNSIYGLPDGSAIYITGAAGIIYRSTDHGATWEARSTGFTESFKHLHCWKDGSGARHVVASGYTTRTVALSSDGGDTWSAVTLPAAKNASTYEQRSLWGLPDGSALYLLTNEYILRSADGGATWAKVADGDPLDFAIWGTLDPLTGETLFMGSGEGRIWQATDAGQLWHIVNEGDVWSLFSVLAFSASEICAVGEGNPSSALSGFFTAGVHGTTTYTKSVVNIFSQALRTIWGTPDYLYAAAANKGICVSTDRGATWSQWLVADKYYLTGLTGGTAPADLVAVGYDATTDEGLILFRGADKSFHSVHGNVGVHLRSVAFLPDRGVYIAVGDQGAIYLSNPAVTVWTAVDLNGATDNLQAVWTPPAGGVIHAVADNGVVLTSTDGGATWTRLQLGIGPLFGVWGTSPTDVFVVGLEIFHYDGTRWTKMTTQNDGTVVTDKFMSVGVNGSADKSRVYAVGLGGRVYMHER